MKNHDASSEELHHTLAAPPSGLAERPVAKFLHASGAKPLEGYTIKRGLGRGGFGEVYFATSDAGKEVALKLVRRNLEVELRGVRHCLNLKHPNLIGVYDIRTDATGDQWVVMEYIAGESLEDAIARHPDGMPPDEAVAWMQGICAGVAYLHDQGLVHRDLKPGNVFLDTSSGTDPATAGVLDGVVKLGDYGLSKFISCSRRSGQTESVGTVHYMAPEIAHGRYGREIDLYALGIILYEMLTGHVPFEGESVGEVLMKHMTAEPDLGRLAEPYREIVRRLLAKDPEERIASAGELLALLGGKQGATPSPVPKQPQPKIRSQPKVPTTSSPEGKSQQREGEEEAVAVAGPPCEPLAAAFVNACREIGHWWHELPMTPAVRVCVIFGLVLFVVMTAGVWLTVGLTTILFYVPYCILWWLLIRPMMSPSARHDEAPHRHHGQLRRHENRPARRAARQSWRDKVHQQLREQPLRERVTELLGSMLLAIIPSGFLSLLAVVVLAGSYAEVDAFPLWLWLTVVSSVGSWLILAVAKFGEGRCEDQIPLRVAMLVGGALLGGLSWSLSAVLLLGLPAGNDFSPDLQDTVAYELFGWPTQQVESYGQWLRTPSQVMSVVYFGLLMVISRWWRLAEYLRPCRLSLLAVLWQIALACGVSLIFWYPQPTGIAVAAVMAITTQLVSRWMLPSERKALASQGLPGYPGGGW